LLAAITLLLKALFATITLASALFASFLLLTATAKANLLALLEPPPDERLRRELDLLELFLLELLDLLERLDLLEPLLLEAMSSPNNAKVKMVIV
jgi:hypothetical protein